MENSYFSVYKSLKDSDFNEFLLLYNNLGSDELEEYKKHLMSEYSSSDILPSIRTNSISSITNTTQLLPDKRMTKLIKSVICDMKKTPDSCEVWDALTGDFKYASGVKHEIIARMIPQIYRLEQKKAFKYSLHRPKPYSKYSQINELLLSQACDKVKSTSLVVSFFDNHQSSADYDFADFINSLLESPVGDWNRLLNRLNLEEIEHGIVLPIVTFIDLKYIPDIVVRTAVPVQYNGQAFRKVRDVSGFNTTQYYDLPKQIKWEIIDEKTTFAD